MSALEKYNSPRAVIDRLAAQFVSLPKIQQVLQPPE